MADNTTSEQILLEIRINSEQYKAEQKQIRDSMAQLTLGIEKNREAQKTLDAARKAGKMSDADYSQQSVKLREELKGQRTSMRELEKGLATSQQAYTSAAGSIDQLKARAAELTTAYNAMGKEERTATESGQRLTAELLEVNKALLGGGVAVNDFRRNVGNYPKGESLAPLIQQLVRLEELQKSGVLTAEQAAQADRDAIGYKQQIAQAGAQEGKSYEDTTALVKSYGDAIRPATAALVQLEQEQQQVAESGKATGEQAAQIGFRFGQAQKSIQDATAALKEVPVETNKAGGSIAQLDQTTGAFGGQVSVLKERFAQAKQAVEASKVGLTGLKGAIAGTGVGVLILALGVLFEYFTKSDEGAEDLAAGLAYLKGAFSVLEGVAVSAGKGLTLVFKDPKEAGKQFVAFLENQVVNRVKSFGVLWDAVRNGDAKGLVNGVIQFSTGIENGTEKVKTLTAEMQRAAGVAQELSRANDKLDDDQRASLVTLEENKNLIDKLVLSARDRSLSEQERLRNLDKASQLEQQSLATTTRLAQDKLRIQQLENAEAERTGKISDEQRDKAAEAQAEVVKLAGQSATLQQTIANRRSALIEQQTAEDKAAAEKARQAAEKALEQKLADQRAQLKLQNDLIDLQVRKVRAGSDEELNLLQHKLENERAIELAQKNVTAAQKRLIDLKYNADSTALLVSFQRQAALATLQAEQERNAASLALNAKAQAEQASQGLQATEQQLAEQYQLQGRAAVLERELALAGLETRKDNTAAELRIRAEANQKLATLDAGQADAGRQRRAQDLSEQAQQYTLLADGMLAGLDQSEQQQVAATETYRQQRIGAIEAETDARLALVEKGSQEEANIRLDFANKLKQIQQDSSQAQLDLLKSQTDKVASVISGSLSSLSALQDADSQAKLARIDAEMNAEGVSAAKKAVLEKQKLRIEQQAAEQRKKLARAQAVVQLGQAVMAILAAPSVLPSPAGEILKGFEIAAATATAYAQFKAIDSAKFARGGMVAVGPSHAQGGIQLLHRGRHAGIEIEGGEPVLTAAVSRSPVLLGMASMINQLAGGRALYRDPTPASTWARWAEGGVTPANLHQYLPQVLTGGVVQPTEYLSPAQLQAQAPAIDYDQLGKALASHLTPSLQNMVTSLPAPSLSLTELRERNNDMDRFAKMMDI
jgi:hypothetical protein